MPKAKDLIRRLEETAMLYAVDPEGEGENLARLVSEARAEGFLPEEIEKVCNEASETMGDLVATFSSLGSVQIGDVKLTPTEKARKLAKLEAPRLERKYGRKRKR